MDIILIQCLLFSIFLNNISIYGETFTAHDPGESATIWWDNTDFDSTLYRIIITGPYVFVNCFTHEIWDGHCEKDHNTMKYSLFYVPRGSSIENHGIGIRVYNLSLQDAGKYRLTIDYIDDDTKVLYVYQEPVQPTLILDHHTVAGGNQTFICNISSLSEPEEYRDHVEFSYNWTITGSNNNYLSDDDKLFLLDVQKSNAGDVVSCTGREGISSFVSVPGTHVVDVYYIQDVHFSVGDYDGIVTVQAGDTMTQSCSALCHPPCRYQWVDMDGVLVSAEAKLIINTTTNDPENRMYTCRVMNEAVTKTRTFTLDLMYPPMIVDFMIQPYNLYQGNSSLLSCSVESKTSPRVTLIDDYGKIIVENNSDIISYRWKMVNCSMNGKYWCRAENNHGYSQIPLIMDVKCPPKITSYQHFIDHGSQEGGFRLSFNVTSNPFPENSHVMIKRLSDEGVQQNVTKEMTINFNPPTITISSLKINENSYGIYVVSLWNMYGQDVSMFEIPRPISTPLSTIALSVVLGFAVVCIAAMTGWWCLNRKRKPDMIPTKTPDAIYENTIFESSDENPTAQQYSSLGPNRVQPEDQGTYDTVQAT